MIILICQLNNLVARPRGSLKMSQIGQYSQSLNLASGDKFVTENAASNVGNIGWL